MEMNSSLWWRDTDNGLKVAAPQHDNLLLCLSPQKIQDTTIHSSYLMCVLLSVSSPLNGNRLCNGAWWTLCMVVCGEEKSQENVWCVLLVEKRNLISNCVLMVWKFLVRVGCHNGLCVVLLPKVACCMLLWKMQPIFKIIVWNLLPFPHEIVCQCCFPLKSSFLSARVVKIII